MANLNEQWIGDWMYDNETGQIVDGPAMNRYEMFMLIRRLRAVIHAHAQTVRDKEAVIEELRTALQDFSRQNCEVGLEALRIRIHVEMGDAWYERWKHLAIDQLWFQFTYDITHPFLASWKVSRVQEMAKESK